MRLIDADALREVLETAVQITPITQKYNKEDVIRAIMDAPTIANGTDSVMIKWTPDLDKLVQDVAFRGLNEFSFSGKSIREWVEIILEQPRWISVKDRLPKSIINKVLVWLEHDDLVGYIGFGHYEKYKGQEIWFDLEHSEAFSVRGYTVTHWMPLPEPPEEVQDESDH